MKTTNVAWVALILILGFADHARADAGTVAAALPNEAAEARYLKQLCTTVQTEYKTYSDAVEAGTRANKAPIDSQALDKAVAESNVHQSLLYKALGDLKDATEVVKAKRGRLPKGYTDPCKLPGVDK
jgi:hypothetical protein